MYPACLRLGKKTSKSPTAFPSYDFLIEKKKEKLYWNIIKTLNGS